MLGLTRKKGEALILNDSYRVEYIGDNGEGIFFFEVSEIHNPNSDARSIQVGMKQQVSFFDGQLKMIPDKKRGSELCIKFDAPKNIKITREEIYSFSDAQRVRHNPIS